MNNFASQGALGNYHSTRAQTAVESADPHKLIDMLMERALARIAIAKGHMQRGETAEKGEHIGGAVAIVDGLRACLDHDSGGELSTNLENLYEYMSRRLVEANLSNDVPILDEVSGLVREIRGAWTAIAEHA
ncbi:MAG: flagellar export chaperone FliS [Pseudomonadota bacterium]